MTYTVLLTPWFVYVLLKNRRLTLPLAILSIAAIISGFHASDGVAFSSLVTSYLLFSCWVIFTFYLAHWIKQFGNLEPLYYRLLAINAVLVLAAVLTFPINGIRPLLWQVEPVALFVEPIPRLKLFTYEASYYSLMMAPLALYFFLRMMARKISHPLLVFIAVAFPLLLSMSFGVLACIALSLIAVSILYFRQLIGVRHNLLMIFFVVLALVALSATIHHVFPDNPISKRLGLILSWQDSSARGRLVDAFVLGYKIAESKSLAYGAGLGQIKHAGHDLIMDYYNYRPVVGNVMRIPNSMGEWLATFGLLGFFLKLAAEWFLFFKTRVYKHPYRFAVFVFIFIYQFTGSYIINPAEAVLWVIAFAWRPCSAQETATFAS
ncbi:MAG: hypothetical protein Kow0075_09400 [Salibacteraceae bacterium]